MNALRQRICKCPHLVVLASVSIFVAGVLSPGATHAQLVITEVMAQSSTNLGPNHVPEHSDWWEITWFGQEPIDITNYTFQDRDTTTQHRLVPPGPPGRLILTNGQSVVLVRDNITTNEARFRDWWGPSLGSQVRILFYRDPGFNSVQDEISLYDAMGNCVDFVSFRDAREGVSFVSDPVTGRFGAYSHTNSCGAFKAVEADDVGSPGFACGPIPLGIQQQPMDQTVCAGSTTVFTVMATGLPRPKFQWYFNGTAIPGATAAQYSITNAQPEQEGIYHVVLTNGLEVLASTPACLKVSTNLSAPILQERPEDIELYEMQTARFRVTACAFPPATYEWSANGVLLPGETGPSLIIPQCTQNMSDTKYCVRVANQLGETSVCARLLVTPKPMLAFTEVMANPLLCLGADWIELLNQGSFPVNLRGYRFFDADTLTGAYVITQAVTLQPGQLVILVENMTADAFRQWWGEANLPPGLVILTYVGFGLATRGDELYLWNAAAEVPEDTVATLEFAMSSPGISKRFGPDCPFGCDSTNSTYGAFAAQGCGDIGSPGYITNPPLRIISVSRDGPVTRMHCRVVAERCYALRFKNSLSDPQWLPVGGAWRATGTLLMLEDSSAGAAPSRFYCVEELPSVDCVEELP